MREDQKSIHRQERDRWEDEHVYRCDTFGMIAKEGLPVLRRWPPSPGHVFCNRALADVDPELEQFVVNPWRPQGVGNVHFDNEVWRMGSLAGRRAAVISSANKLRTRAMPTHNCLRLEDL
jgi:hypothetical protein